MGIRSWLYRLSCAGNGGGGSCLRVLQYRHITGTQSGIIPTDKLLCFLEKEKPKILAPSQRDKLSLGASSFLFRSPDLRCTWKFAKETDQEEVKLQCLPKHPAFYPSSIQTRSTIKKVKTFQALQRWRLILISLFFIACAPQQLWPICVGSDDSCLLCTNSIVQMQWDSPGSSF